MGLQTGGHQTLAAGTGTFGYELIMRDKNHPSMIIWSVANEPVTGSAPDVSMPEAVAAGTSFFRQLYDETRRLDRTRPVTLVGMQGGPAEWLGLFHIVSINRYYRWYNMPGQP